MRKLLLFHSYKNLDLILHELHHSGHYSSIETIALQLDSDHLTKSLDEHHEKITQAKRDKSTAFIVGDAQMLNQRRLAVYMAVKLKGISIASMYSAKASISPDIRLRENVYIDQDVRVLRNANIGANTWIMQGSQLGAGCKIGSSCWIGRNCLISERAVLGKNCTLGDGVIIGPDVILPDWSVISQHGAHIEATPKTTAFLDPRFRAPVFLFH